MRKLFTKTVFSNLSFRAYQIIAIFLVITFFIVNQAAAQAQNKASGPNFFLKPATYNPAIPATKAQFILSAKPGTTLQEAVRVTNTGNATGEVAIYPIGVTTSQNGGIAYLSKKDVIRGSGAWTKLAIQQVKLAAGQSQTISFQIVVPNSASAGQHLGAIAAENLTNSITKGQLRINVVTRSIVPIEINLPGPLVERLSASQAKVGGSDGYQNVTMGLANTGNTLLKPNGNLAIKNNRGQLLQIVPVKLDTFLPDTAINYPVSLKKALGAGTYQLFLQLSYGHGKTLSYTTRLAVSQDQVNQVFSNGPLQAPTSNSMPLWQIILVALAAIIVLLVGGQKIYSMIAARRRKQVENVISQEGDENNSTATANRKNRVA